MQRLLPNLREYRGIYLAHWLRERTTILNQGSRRRGRVLNLGPPKYKEAVPSIRPWRPVIIIIIIIIIITFL
jgi:hypothetical protein